jgi:hypothetical protein
MGALYAATIFMCFNNCGTVQPVVGVERTVFYREKAAGMYSAIPYALAQVMIEILYVLIQAALYCSITYAMIGFEWTTVKFFWYFYIMFCSLLAFTNYGMMMVGLTPNGQLAVILASFFYSLFNLFSGFLIPMPVSLTPVSSKFFFPAQCIHLLRTHNMYVFPIANAVPFRNQSHAHLSGCDDDAVIPTAHSCMVDMVLLDLSIGMDNVWAYGITVW